MITPSGPFRLDPNVIADIEKDWVKSDELFDFLDKYKPIDISYMETPIRVIPVNGISYPEERFQKLLSNQSLKAYAAQSGGGGDNFNSYTVSPPQARPPTIAAKQKPTSKYVLHSLFSFEFILIFFYVFYDWIFFLFLSTMKILFIFISYFYLFYFFFRKNKICFLLYFAVWSI